MRRCSRCSAGATEPWTARPAHWSGSLPRQRARCSSPPFGGAAHRAGNGVNAPDRATVDAVHALALELGGACEGSPGLRFRYHPHYYGA